MGVGSGLVSQGITINFKANLDGLTSGANQAKSMLSNFSSAATGGLKEIEGASGSASSAMGGVVTTVVALGAAAVAVGVKATLMAADYERSMLKVQALTGASTDQMKQFDSGLKQLSMETGVVPKKLSEGLYNVVSAGYQGTDAMTLLGLATKDSVIGMTDASVTTKSLTALLAQFSLGAKDANRVNGEMLETVTLGSGTFEQYSSSIVKSASAASQFHESMETMNAAYATLTSSQINAAQASTDFQQSLKVMDGNIGVVSKSLNKSGIAFDEAKFNTMDYGHKVVYLNTALDEANAKHVKVTGVTLQAAQAIQTIAQHIDVYNKDLTTLSDRQAMAAKTQEAWSVTQQGFTVSMERLKATANVVMIDIGQKLLPIATAGVNLLNDAFQGLMDMAGKVSDSFNAFGASLDKVGIRKLAGDFSYFSTQVNYLFQVIQGIGMSIFAQFNTHLVDTHTLVGFVSTVMQDLGNVFRVAGEKVESFRKYLQGTNIPSSVMDGYNKFKTLLEDTAKVIGYVLYEAFEKAKNVYQEFIDILKLPIVQLFIEDIRKLGIAVGNTFGIIKDTGIKVFNQFKTVFDDSRKAADDFNNALSKITGISGLPGKQIEDIKNKLKGGMKIDFGVQANPHPNFLDLPQNAKNIKPPEAGKSAGGAGGFAGGGQLLPIMDMIGKATKAFQDFGNSLSHIDMTPFAGGLLQLKNAVGNILSLQWDQLKTVFKDLGADAKQLGGWFKSDVAPAIKDALPGFANLGMSILTDVIPTFIKVRSVVIDVMQHAFEKFAPIIEKIVPPLIKFAGVLANDIANGLKFIMPYILQAAKAIGDFANEIMDRVAPIIKKWIDGMMPGFQFIANWWNTNWPMMAGVLKSVWEMIAGVVKVAWALVSGIIKIGLDMMMGNWSQVWTDMKTMLSGVWDGIKTYLGGAFDAVNAMFTNVWSQLTPQMKQPFQDAWNFIQDIFNKIQNVISNITGQKIQPNTSQIMTGQHHFASGVENFGGGLAYVHANEMLVNLPKGTSVWNPAKTAEFMKPVNIMNTAKSTSQYPTAGSVGGGGAPVIHVHVHPVVQPNDIYMDTHKVTSAVTAHQANMIRLKGDVRRH